jgi:dethiobiotin synthetase
VVLVVGLRLGCLNHALLSAEAIVSRGLHLAGWVGNHLDPSMPEQAANLDFLHSRLPAPCLGTVPHLQPPDPLAAARGLRFPP